MNFLLRVVFCFFLCGVFFLPAKAFAAVTIPFTINMSKIVTVTGSPRIAVDVGGVTRYAVYSAGTGTATLTFTYSVQSGDVDADGVVLTSPVQLNGGTITDAAGNPANLAFTLPNTTGILVNGAVPSGYTALFSDDTVTNVNKTALSFVLTSPKLNRVYNYTITSSGGGTPLTGTGTQITSPQTMSGINVTSLPDGLLTLSLTLTDSIGGVGVATTDTIPMAVLNANLVGHWTFDSNDISGVTAYDRSGSTLNGTLQGTPTSFVGRIGRGLKFDGFGSGDMVSLGASATLNPANFTITAWVSPANISGVYGYIYSNARDCCGAYKGIEMRLAVNKLGATIWNTSSAQLATTGTIANSSGWHHVAYTYDGSTIKLYIDGNFDFQLATALGVGGPASFGTYIGTMGFNAGTYTLDGILDDVRIYNTPLTAGQVSTLYATH